jgi:hypothetical protein
LKTTKTFYEQTIVDNIDFSGYEDNLYILGAGSLNGEEFDEELYVNIHNVFHIFIYEYNWRLGQLGSGTKAFSEWLSGLPSVLSVPFYYSEMIQNAKDFGMTIKDEDEFCATYFDRLAEAFFTLKENL